MASGIFRAENYFSDHSAIRYAITPPINNFSVMILFEVTFSLMGTTVTLRLYHNSKPQKKKLSLGWSCLFLALAKILGTKRSLQLKVLDHQ